MTFEIKRVERTGAPLKSDRRLYVTQDDKTVVEANDPRAAFLLCGTGGEIPRARAVELGLGIDSEGRISIDGKAALPDLPPEKVGMIADRRIFLHADGKTVCEADDRKAAILLAAEGDTISPETVVLLGLSEEKGRVVQKKQAGVSEDKQRAPGEDKQLAGGEDKTPKVPDHGAPAAVAKTKKRGSSK